MTASSRHQTRQRRCDPNIIRADVLQRFTLFIFTVEPRERVCKFVNHHTDERGRAGQSCVCRLCRQECTLPADTKRWLPPDTHALTLRHESCCLFTQVFSFSPLLSHHLLKQWAQCGPHLQVGRTDETGGQLGPSGLLWSECLHGWEEALF